MTRNFRDEWETSIRDAGEPIASAAEQDQIAALLRGAAARDTASMPDDVDARIRAALTAEMMAARAQVDEASADPGSSSGDAFEAGRGAGADAGLGAAVVADLDADRDGEVDAPAAVPLPAQRPAASGHPGGAEHTSEWVAAPTSHPLPVRSTSPAATETGGARDGHEAATARDGSTSGGASVVSLDAHRRRRSPLKAVMALGAAAAVAIGAVAVVKHGDTRPAPAAAPSVSSTDYASRVRVTQTQTKYSSAGLARQAAALMTSTAPEIEPVQANAQSLGPMATGSGVQDCLRAVAKGLVTAPDKVYADLATYDGKPAVIVVAVKGTTSTAWVVSRTCSTASDLEAGPTTVHT